jgi:hypothetical protein
MFTESLATGKSTEIVVNESEYKGARGLDVRKYYRGEPTRKGAFLDIEKGQAFFVLKALPTVLQGGDEQVMEAGRLNLVVKRYDYKGMESYSTRKESTSGTWGKGIWVKPDQAAWVLQQMGAALAQAQ